MNYEIALLDFFSGKPFWSDETSFIEKHGLARLEWNLDRLWIWNLANHEGFESDGLCIHIKWIH